MGAIRPQIVLFGDSLVEFSFQVDKEGWGAALANHFNRKADVVLRGLGGYNTRLAQLILDNIFPLPSPNPPMLVIVSLGGNDAADPNASHKRLHVPLQEYVENLRKIVAHLKKLSESTKIILLSPPPVSEKTLSTGSWLLWRDESGVPTRRDKITRQYAEACVKVARELDVWGIDLWSTFKAEPDWEEKYLCDGLHTSAAGNAKVFEELMKIVEVGPPLKAKKLPWDFPSIIRLGEDPVAGLQAWCTRSRL